MLFRTFVIPAEDILELQVRPPFSMGDMFRGKVRVRWWVLKLDWADVCEHVEIHRKSGWFKWLRFTPGNPAQFAAACESIRK